MEIGKVTASDPDTVGSLHFAISNRDMKHLFKIGEYNGVLFVHANSSSLFVESQYKVNIGMF